MSDPASGVGWEHELGWATGVRGLRHGLTAKRRDELLGIYRHIVPGPVTVINHLVGMAESEPAVLQEGVVAGVGADCGEAMLQRKQRPLYIMEPAQPKSPAPITFHSHPVVGI